MALTVSYEEAEDTYYIFDGPYLRGNAPTRIDAVLFAAAPELLSALQELMDELNSWVWDSTGVFGVSAGYHTHLEGMVRKAIAKAEGRVK